MNKFIKNNIPGRTLKSLDGLFEMIKYINKFIDCKELIIMEIGSWIGASACLFANHFKKVICIDPFIPINGTITKLYDMDVIKKTFFLNILDYKNITYINHKSIDFLPNLDKKSIDVIYIDGDHDYDAVRRNIEISLPIATHFISGHDYWPGKFDGVIKAVDEFMTKPDKIFPDTSWIKRI